MSPPELQVENGNYTRIINPLIEALIKIPFKGCELAVALYVIRKTYGFNKKQDEISLSQFCEGTGRSRQTVVTALKNLQLVKTLRLVKRGTSKTASNIWEINKYVGTWQLVKTSRLVKRKGGQLVKTSRHTKDNTKDNISSKEDIQQAGTITELDKYLKESQGLKHLDGQHKWNRIYARHILRRFGGNVVKVKRFIDFALSIPFHKKNATNFKYLFNHINQIALEYKNRAERNPTYDN